MTVPSWVEIMHPGKPWEALCAWCENWRMSPRDSICEPCWRERKRERPDSDRIDIATRSSMADLQERPIHDISPLAIRILEMAREMVTVREQLWHRGRRNGYRVRISHRRLRVRVIARELGCDPMYVIRVIRAHCS